MTTLMEPPVPDLDPAPMAITPPGPLVRVHANLLPGEIVASRRLAHLKRRLAVAMTAFVVLLGLAYAYSLMQTGQAKSDLADAQSQGTQLSTNSGRFTDLLRAQSDTAQIRTQLGTAMANDVDWTALLTTIDKASGPNVAIVGLNATMVDADGAAAGAAAVPDPLNNTGQPVVGSLTITGAAHDYSGVAGFVDTLSKVKGMAVVQPAAVSREGSVSTFTVTVSLTSDILRGRYQTSSGPAPTSGAPTTTGGN